MSAQREEFEKMVSNKFSTPLLARDPLNDDSYEYASRNWWWELYQAETKQLTEQLNVATKLLDHRKKYSHYCNAQKYRFMASTEKYKSILEDLYSSCLKIDDNPELHWALDQAKHALKASKGSTE